MTAPITEAAAPAPKGIKATEADIGRRVVYTPFAGCNPAERERGTITGMNHRFVFVRYGRGDTSQATEKAKAAVEAARAQIALRCQEMGIPVEFAPDIGFHWHGRGHNAVAERRAELRRAAKKRVEAIEAEALTKIERMSLEAQEQVIAHGLESDAAKAFLEAMPTIQKLMPSVQVEEIQSLLETQRAEKRSLYLN